MTACAFASPSSGVHAPLWTLSRMRPKSFISEPLPWALWDRLRRYVAVLEPPKTQATETKKEADFTDVDPNDL